MTTPPPFNVYTYGPKSLSGVIMRARMLAVQGKSATEIADELDVHVVAAAFVVDQWQQHKTDLRRVTRNAETEVTREDAGSGDGHIKDPATDAICLPGTVPNV